MSEVMQYDPSKGLGPTDRILLRGAGAGKSPEELSALTNGVVSPARAAARVLEILENRNWLTEAQRKMLLIDEMHALKDTLMKKAIDFENVAAARALTTLFAQIDKSSSQEKLDFEKAKREIDAAHGRLWLDAISLALERSFLVLEQRHPDIAKAELLEVFHEAMPDVVKQVEGLVPASS